MKHHHIMALIPIFILTACGGGESDGTTPPPITSKDVTSPIVSFSPSTVTLPEQVRESISVSASDNIGVVNGPSVECYSGLKFENGVLVTPAVIALSRGECVATAHDAEGNVGRATLYVTIEPQVKSDEQKMNE